jgi:hypothetical protein
MGMPADMTDRGAPRGTSPVQAVSAAIMLRIAGVVPGDISGDVR